MKIALRAPAIAAAAGVLAAIQATACAEPPQEKTAYQPDLRPAVFINFAPRTPTPQNPHGYQRDWLDPERAEKWMRSQFARGDRIIVRTPFGNDAGGWVTSKQWHVAVEWRRRLFLRVLNQWLAEDPDRTFSLYIGTLFGDPHDRTMEGALSPSPDDPEALGYFLTSIKPWLRATKIHRVWLDHASGPMQNRKNVVKLAAWCRRNLDLTVGMEALPRDGRELDWETMRQVPTLCTWRFPETFNKDKSWTIPDGYEVLLIVIPQKRAPTPMLETVTAYRTRGFIVGSGHRDFDLMARNANATPRSRPIR